MKKKHLAFTLIGILIVGIIASFFFFGRLRNLVTGHPAIFSKGNMLQSLWYHYKLEYMEPSTMRVYDKSQSYITTSEGESYAMLRAVWMDDKPTFDTSWQWTKNNLQHSDDHLFAWLFGKRADGSYGILTDRGGMHSATDADSDIALALLFASRRWNDDSYRYQAVQIINDIWDKEVVIVNGKPYLAANNLEKTDQSKNTHTVNPSYFSPYAYRIFAVADPKHPWHELVDTSYEVLNDATTGNLDASSSASLPPNWLAINKVTGKITAAPGANLDTNYSFDALRIPWRISLDKEWFNDPRATAYLEKLGYLDKEWHSTGKLASSYTHDGAVVDDTESPAMYGGSIGYFELADPAAAATIYRQKLEALYNPDTYNWNTQLGYYDANWAWFGIALYNNLLPNLYPTNQ